MPIYEYRCHDCRRKVRHFYTYSDYDSADPVCPHCGSRNLRRLINSVAVAKSEDARLETMDPERMMAGLDENDPRSLGRFMRQMGSEMGEDLGDEFGEVVDRLEKGQSPEDIEQAMPDLAEGAGTGDDAF